ncbi:MAG: hypothetical protein ABI742_09595 [Gemmatimonadota bacterium]
MEQLPYLLCPAILGCLILAVELGRYRRGHAFDALRLASAIYFLAYAVVPFQLHFADLSAFRGGAWNWAVQFEPDDTRLIYGSLIGLLGYLGLLVGHATCAQLFPRDHASPEKQWSAREQGALLRAALLLAAVGTAALVIYTVSIGGMAPLLLQAAAFRTRPPVITRWAFLKNVAPIVVSATMVVAGLYAVRGPAARRRLGWLLGCLWLISFVLLFHRAARLPLIAFLIMLPLARALRRGRLDPVLVVGAITLFLGLVLFGKAAFSAGSSADLLRAQWSTISDDAALAVNSILLEFSFPFVTASNVVTAVPALTPYRWFQDAGIAVLYLVPQRISGITPPATVSMINSETLHGQGVPVDIASFGYFSAGIPGVALTTLLFGAFLFMIDRMVRRYMRRESPLFVLGIALQFYAGFTLMYGDPQLVLESGFPLILSIGVVVTFLRLPGALAGLARPGEPPVRRAPAP